MLRNSTALGVLLTLATLACNSVTGLDGLSFDSSGTTTSTSASSAGGSAANGGAGGMLMVGGGGAGGGGGGVGSDYAAAVLADSPLGYWRLGESGGTVAADASGSGRDGTYVGSVLLGEPGALAGEDDTAASFDGMTSVVMGDVLDFPGATPFSVEAWIKPTLTQTDYQGVCGKRTGTANTEGYILRITPEGRPDFSVFSNDSKATAELMFTLAMNEFSHLVGTFDGTTLVLYLNGVAVATAASPGPIADTAAPLAVGADPGNDPFDGVIDEVAIYGVALSPERVAAHHQAGVTP